MRTIAKVLKVSLAMIFTLLFLRLVMMLGEVTIPHPHPSAYLRVSFRFRPPLTSACRPPHPHEFDHLPFHMRPKEVCARGFVAYRLRVVVDGKEMILLPLNPKGARHDRPIGVDELLPLPPGEHQVELALTPQEGGYPPIFYNTSVTLSRSEVAVITLGQDHSFSLLTPAHPSPP